MGEDVYKGIPQSDPVNAPFHAAEGFKFFVGGKPHVIRAGVYGNGYGALQVWTDGGEQECKLTVNLTEQMATLQPGEFFIRQGDYDESPAPKRLLALGLFVETPRRIGAGYSTHYAGVWAFRRCAGRSSRHGHKPGDFAVCCKKCLASWDRIYEAERLKMLAKDTVRRLNNGMPWD